MRLNTAVSLLLAVAVVGCGKKDAAPPSSSSSPPPAPVSSSSPPPSPGSQTADAIDPATTGTISGVVKLDGWLRPDVKVPMQGVPACAMLHPDGVPVGETLIMGDGQAMANVLVYVKNGLGKRKFDAPKDAVVMDQVGCIYVPHVRALQVNQPLLVRNGDTVMHNVSFKPTLNNPANRGQPTKGAQDTFTFPIPETGIFLKCDVHPWMGAWVHVLANPFFQLTGKDGAFKISGLPPGEYEIHAWHERFTDKPMVAMVNLEAKGNVTQDFIFKGGEKK